MAEQIQAIKRHINSVKNTEKITGAMKLISAARLKQSTDHLTYAKDHIEPLISKFAQILTCDIAPEVYYEKRLDMRQFEVGTVPHSSEDPVKELCILITSCKGLCGGYNSSLIKHAAEMNENAGTVFVPLGDKGFNYCIKHGLDIFEVEKFSDIYADHAHELTFNQILKLSSAVLELYRKSEISKIKIVYTKYRNPIAFDIDTKLLFPLEKIGPGGDGDIDNTSLFEHDNDHAYFNEIARSYLSMKILRYIAEATLCEHAARRIAMKNANDNALKMIETLSNKYHTARQNAITGEMIEIIVGHESQKMKKVQKKIGE